MFALLDCNNFYVSCERIFNPSLDNRAVVVLSNNDGCIISRSNEAKKLGIKMGEPLFKVKNMIERSKIIVKSSNYSFYGDISNRIMNILKKNCDKVEIYSIDEAFFNLEKIRNPDLFCYEISKKIRDWTGIPVSIGIGKTKTLSKVINRVIKKKSDYKSISFEYENVLNINSNQNLEYILKNTKINDIWGVGKGLTKFLINNGIKNALELSECNENFIRRQKGILLERTVLELRGISCHKLETDMPKKKSITVSRSFGKRLKCCDEIKEALIVYVQRAAKKLRNHNLFCKSISIFLKTSRYDVKLYQNEVTHNLSEATNDVRIIWKVSSNLLNRIYKKSFLYSKVGVILSSLVTSNQLQRSLLNDDIFEKSGIRNKSLKLMKLIDKVNNEFGEGKLRLSSDKSGCFYLKRSMRRNKNKGTNWLMKSSFRSPSYTTNWCEIPKVKTNR